LKEANLKDRRHRFSDESEISGRLDLCGDELELDSSRVMSKARGSMPVRLLDQDEQDQLAIIEACLTVIYHFFGGPEELF
jgi:hypothetical protein